MKRDIKTAITFRASSIGDVLMAKYLLENVHVEYKSANCFIVVSGKAEMLRGLLEQYPWIKMVELNRQNWRGALKFFWQNYPSDFTVTQYSGRGQFSTATKLFARIITRRNALAGFKDDWRFNGIFYDHLIPFDSRRALRLHEMDALKSYGIIPKIEALSLIVGQENSVLNHFQVEEGQYLILNLFSGSAKRGLLLKQKIEIARAAQETVGGKFKLVATGGKADEEELCEIIRAVPAIISAGSISLKDMVELIGRSGCVVSLDTGVAHIAAQTGRKLVVMRICHGYNWWNSGQYSLDNIRVLSHDEICKEGHEDINYPKCLGSIAVHEVVTALRELVMHL